MSATDPNPARRTAEGDGRSPAAAAHLLRARTDVAAAMRPGGDDKTRAAAIAKAAAAKPHLRPAG